MGTLLTLKTSAHPFSGRVCGSLVRLDRRLSYDLRSRWSYLSRPVLCPLAPISQTETKQHGLHISQWYVSNFISRRLSTNVTVSSLVVPTVPECTDLVLVFFVLDHYVWFSYFSSKPFMFWDILAFFLLCVWLIPFVYFISLTSEDSSLPYGSLSACMLIY